MSVEDELNDEYDEDEIEIKQINEMLAAKEAEIMTI